VQGRSDDLAARSACEHDRRADRQVTSTPLAIAPHFHARTITDRPKHKVLYRVNVNKSQDMTECCVDVRLWEQCEPDLARL
jgi:hypothetical protein